MYPVRRPWSRPIRLALVAFTACAVALTGCSSSVGSATRAPSPAGSAPLSTTEADWKSLADALGRTGKLMDGKVYRVSLPRKDLAVTTQGVAIKPGLALGGYAAFAKYNDGTLLMGDLVVTEAELQNVTGALQAAGIEQTAIHKHLLQQTPAIWWAHVHVMGDPVTIAKGLKTALATTATPPGSPPPTTQPPVDLDTAAIDAALGRKGTADGGIYKFTIGRRDTVIAGGHILPPALGITTAVNFQPLGAKKAAINGDFVMTASEVQRVMQALHKGGIDVVELHNHGLDEQPRLFYLHFWATGDGATLAKALRPALDATNLTAPSS